jgi:Myb-like DNA-binding domain
MDAQTQEPLIQPAPEQSHEATQAQAPHTDANPRRPRSKWTDEETQDLVKGCSIHGVGNWKKYIHSNRNANNRILTDPNLKFYNRTSVDLKDRCDLV